MKIFQFWTEIVVRSSKKLKKVYFATLEWSNIGGGPPGKRQIEMFVPSIWGRDIFSKNTEPQRSFIDSAFDFKVQFLNLKNSFNGNNLHN